MAMARPEVITGTPICRRAAFVLDKFLANQREIQQAYPDCRMVLATDEPDFVAELEEQIELHHLKGEVITYETVKPDYARSRIWSVTCGREMIRQYALLQGAEYLLCLDGDMVYEPSLISIMKSKIQGFDVAYSGFRFRRYGTLGFGTSCFMINRKILSKMTFRCYEFRNGQELDDGESIFLELFRYHARLNKGFFLPIKHYRNSQEYYAVEPQPMRWYQILTHIQVVRYILTMAAVLTRYNIARKLHILFHRRIKFLPRRSG
jgi:hypothetical protein